MVDNRKTASYTQGIDMKGFKEAEKVRAKSLMIIFVAFAFVFVLATQDIHAAQKSRQIVDEVMEQNGLDSIDQQSQVNLMKQDVVLGYEDGGAYYRSSYLWVWLVLLLVVLLVVLLVLASSYDWWWYY